MCCCLEWGPLAHTLQPSGRGGEGSGAKGGGSCDAVHPGHPGQDRLLGAGGGAGGDAGRIAAGLRTPGIGAARRLCDGVVDVVDSSSGICTRLGAKRLAAILCLARLMTSRILDRNSSAAGGGAFEKGGGSQQRAQVSTFLKA